MDFSTEENKIANKKEYQINTNQYQSNIDLTVQENNSKGIKISLFEISKLVSIPTFQTSFHDLLESVKVGKWRFDLAPAVAKGFMLPEAQAQHVLHVGHFRGTRGCRIEHGTLGTFPLQLLKVKKHCPVAS